MCPKCNDTGIWETGNNDLPCDCPLGAKAQFNVAGVDGLVTGAEVEAHFLNGSPDPIRPNSAHPVSAWSLPGRREN